MTVMWIFAIFAIISSLIPEGTAWCTGGYENIDGTCYHVNQERESWLSALSHCTRDNSTLVEIRDVQTDTLIREHEIHEEPYWIGLRRVAGWKWLNGQAIIDYHWSPGEPRDNGYRIALQWNSGRLGWSSLSSNQNAHCACQIHNTPCSQVRQVNHDYCLTTNSTNCILVDYNTDCYFLSNRTLETWITCMMGGCYAETQYLNSVLAVIDDVTLLTKVENAISTTTLVRYPFWTGGYLDISRSTDIWNNDYNDAADYTAWHEPPANQQCAVINGTSGWIPTNCTATNKFICQKDQTCTPNECVGGTCNNGTCVCRPGWAGEKCDKDDDECSGEKTVCNHGWCNNTAGSYTCDCKQGWAGELCDTDVDECLDEHQHHCYHGNCSNVAGSYRCICHEGWTGAFCFEDVDECEPGTTYCLRGTCDNLNGNYSCTCHAGWTGPDCGTDINECEPGRPHCIHGTCINLDGNYYCGCHTGWVGPACDIDINECGMAPSPCIHGNCTNTAGSYQCDCLYGWTGASCAEEGHCPSGFAKYKHKCFQFMKYVTNWSHAEVICHDVGGHLVIVKSPQDMDDAYYYVYYHTGDNNFWIDAEKHSGVWRWHTTKESMTYFRWGSGEPKANNNCIYQSVSTMYSYSCVGYPSNVYILCEAEMITHTSSNIIG